MAGSFSNFLELELLDHVFGNAAYTAPASLYFALFTVTPSDTGGGTEVTGGSYDRKSMTNNATNFPAASAGSKSNGTDITFVTATASWGTVVGWGVFDASTSGNLLAWGDLTYSKTIGINDTATFVASSLVLTLD